jgi:hypothetical protein
MRYRPSRTIPGVNPPTGSESDEIRCPTGEGIAAAAATATDAAGDSTAAVGACETELTGAPQARQNLSDGKTSPPQDGHFMTPFLNKFSDAFNAEKLIGAIFLAPLWKVNTFDSKQKCLKLRISNKEFRTAGTSKFNFSCSIFCGSRF